MGDHFVHESSVVDDNVVIGEDRKVWHFCHIQSDSVIGSGCNIGQVLDKDMVCTDCGKKPEI